MATTRNAPDPSPPADPPAEGFTAAQRTELEELIRAAVGGATPPPQPDEPKGPRRVSDDEWDTMSDRARESWVRQLVDFRLDELSRDDEIARQRAEIDALKAGGAEAKPEPEQPPGLVSKLQKFLWGEPDPK